MPAALKHVALIVAGGTGTRMGSDIPKQFLLLRGRPVLMHTIEKFHSLCDEVIVVLPADWMMHWQALCSHHNFTIECKLVAGGVTRAESVKNGLSGIDPNAIVAVHDSARPLVSRRLIKKLYIAAKEHGSAIPVIHMFDSIRVIEGDANRAVDRSSYRQVQTPQCFRADKLLNAFNRREFQLFTDEASLLEADGHQVHLVEGEPTNIKLTLPADFIFAEYYLLSN